MNCAAPNADWTVISNCAELTLIPTQLFPVGFSYAEKLYNCTTFKHTKKTTGNNCAGIKVNSAQLETNCPVCIWSCTVYWFYPRTNQDRCSGQKIDVNNETRILLVKVLIGPESRERKRKNFLSWYDNLPTSHKFSLFVT